ncbi:DUF488 domain-containing protein [Cellulomonas pakistanensis]|uniref:DUF488 domain-containing protein n=1 Tax=Cellulomonas pakistanensis TaxID=992287 RepID=A0A919PCV0_9CELL|nr:DUF488 domain-containing protein [Cellulomonas pakistanensis]GIG36559.1 hypothetical protein Cpa01nite_19400 [Cellulomonas pakistanensis]
MTDLAARLHGWGYEGRTVDDLIEFAHATASTVVVDVRLTPISRRPGFSKRRLAAALDEAGLGYLHLRALGNPRDNRPGFAEPATPAGAAAHRRFASEVLTTEGARAAVDRLVELAGVTDLVVVCFEADQTTCHRRLVIEAVASHQLVAA